MASRKTAPTATAPKATRTRKPKAETAPAAVAMSPREKELASRYKHQAIIPGSWAFAGHPDRQGIGSRKATVIVRCKSPDCTHTRIVCTSDLQWQTTAYCVEGGCAKRIHSNHRATKAQKKKLK
ncbi:MAG TPA: hypothetical protein VD866_15375 [Urbifossiella sp.]|nr:hypothetical protein [Urbifossiella sp.]